MIGQVNSFDPVSNYKLCTVCGQVSRYMYLLDLFNDTSVVKI